MRVTSAEVVRLRAALRTPAGPAGAYNRQRETLLLRLESSTGAVGWGETYAVGGTAGLLRELAGRLVGARLDRPPPLPPGLDEGIASFALGAIDIGWHDLRGRVLGVPVHILLGGAVRERVRAYASGFLYHEGEAPGSRWLAEASALQRQGFQYLKLRIGGYPPAVELDRLARLRDQLPADVTLLVDAWGSYSPATALTVGRRLGELGVAWFEEPTHVPSPSLAARLDIPVAGGELGRTRAEFHRMVERREFDILQPDVAICGGLRTAQFVAELAATNGIGCTPHTWNGPVMAAATLHLAAVMPPAGRTGDVDGGPLLEVDTSENPFMRDIVHNPPSLVDGCIPVTDSPGLGIELDEAALDRYRVN